MATAGFSKITFSYPEPACAVILRCPRTPSPHGPPKEKRKRKTKPQKSTAGKKRKEKTESSAPLLLHFHGRLSGPFLLRHSNLRLALLLLGGRGSLLGFLGPRALLPPLGGWRPPPPGLPPGLPLGTTDIGPSPVRSSAVGTLHRSMRAWAAPFPPYTPQPGTGGSSLRGPLNRWSTWGQSTCSAERCSPTHCNVYRKYLVAPPRRYRHRV